MLIWYNVTLDITVLQDKVLVFQSQKECKVQKHYLYRYAHRVLMNLVEYVNHVQIINTAHQQKQQVAQPACIPVREMDIAGSYQMVSKEYLLASQKLLLLLHAMMVITDQTQTRDQVAQNVPLVTTAPIKDYHLPNVFQVPSVSKVQCNVLHVLQASTHYSVTLLAWIVQQATAVLKHINHHSNVALELIHLQEPFNARHVQMVTSVKMVQLLQLHNTLYVQLDSIVSIQSQTAIHSI
jgi:hypothetical protein